MTKSIFRCEKCKKYTLDPKMCPDCQGKTLSSKPARFSLEKEKKYSKYRRQLIQNK